MADEPRIDVAAEHEDGDIAAPASFLMAVFRAYRGRTVQLRSVVLGEGSARALEQADSRAEQHGRECDMELADRNRH
ncbi:hypothetical protein ACWF5H_06465 [Arthrobacter sp. NPDC055138]